MIKIIFMGSPEFSVKALEKLNIHPDISVELVISQEDKARGRNKFIPTAVKKKALELGLKTYEPARVNSRESLEIIDKVNPDFIVVIAYGQIIGSHLLEKYEDRIINIHSSLLPKYRGASPMQEAILRGDDETGVCSMLIEKSMDTGDVLKCVTSPITSETTIIDLHDDLAAKAADLILDTILNYDDYYATRICQDDSLASYCSKLEKSMGHIDFNKTAREIDLKVRAFKGWPSTFAILNGQNVKIHKVSIIDKYNDIKEGIIHRADESGIYVNSKDKCVVIKEIQFPNKKRMPVSDFLKGNKIDLGAQFN